MGEKTTVRRVAALSRGHLVTDVLFGSSTFRLHGQTFRKPADDADRTSSAHFSTKMSCLYPISTKVLSQSAMGLAPARRGTTYVDVEPLLVEQIQLRLP